MLLKLTVKRNDSVHSRKSGSAFVGVLITPTCWPIDLKDLNQKNLLQFKSYELL